MKRVFCKDYGYGTVLAVSLMDRAYWVKWDYRPIEPQWIPIQRVTEVEGV